MSKFAYKHAAPHHVSAGALIYNREGNVLAHHFDAVIIPDTHQRLTDIYLLMRETLEDNEPLEAAVHRGMMAEMGVEGRITDYLGPIPAHIPRDKGDIEKLTLYFSVLCTSFDASRRSKTEDEYEYHTTIDWHQPAFLIEKLKQQGVRYEREDVDESVIIERFLAHS